MCKELGERKATHWISAKKLAWRPDSVTGSLEADLIEHAVPQDWQQMTDAELTDFKIRVENDLTDADAQAAVSMMEQNKETADNEQQSEGGSSNNLVPVIKQEQLSAKDQAKKEAESAWQEFQANKRIKLSDFQTMEIHARVLLNQLMKEQYSEALQGDIRKHANRLAGVTKILSRAMLEDMKAAEFPRLQKVMAMLTKADRTFHMHATRFGIKLQSTKRRRTV